MKDLKNKTFEQILDELDKLIQEDFKRFKEDLKKLSIQENMDKIFENPLNASKFVNYEDSKPSGQSDYEES